MAFLLNLGFSVLELLGGIMTNSVAILSDSVHDLGDALVIGGAYLLERKSRGGVDDRHSYGYRRWSTVGAFVTTSVLLIGSGAVLTGAVSRLLSPAPVDHDGMLWFALFGIIMNGFAAWKTSGGHSLNQRAVSLHMLEDVLGWIAVLAGAIVIKVTGWLFVDSLISIAIATFIAYNAFGNLMSVMPIFLETVPDGMSPSHLAEIVMTSVDGVVDVHHVHIWRLDEETTLVTMHVVWNPDKTEPTVVKGGVRNCLLVQGITHATIEMEVVGEECLAPCSI